MPTKNSTTDLAFESETLVELVRRRAQHQPDAQAYIFLRDGETDEARLTYAQLDTQARTIAAQLQRLDLCGERALLLFPAGLDYIATFFGCLYAGVIVVPIYPPHQGKPERSLPRLRTIAQSAQPRIALMPAVLQPLIEPLAEQFAGGQELRCLATDTLDPQLASAWCDPRIDREMLAFLQYTSGSTAAPRGVMVSHHNLLHNQRMIAQAFDHSSKTIFCGWLPLYHDMGLIGNVLQPMYLGIPCTLMSPVHFLQRPLRWLQAISRSKATTSGGPNFAYELCARQITAEECQGLDLSSWQVAFNGAEPVRAETIERFSAMFEPYGFRRTAFYPCYGLAEATLFVTGVQAHSGATAISFQSAALEQRRAALAEPGDAAAQVLVHSGQPWLDLRLAIVDPETGQRCPPDQIGEIWIGGPSVAQGYWNQPEQTQATFEASLADAGEGPFLRTGDLGMLREGQLFVVGRLKDLIIIRGRNHYPHDIELTVERSHPDLRAGCGAACAMEIDDEERLLIVQEVERRALRHLDVDEVATAIRQAVAEAHEVDVYAIVLLKPGSIPKTSSGKIQRHACRLGFQNGALAAVGQWQQPRSADELVVQPAGLAVSAPAAHATVEAIQSWMIQEVARQQQIAPQSIDIWAPLTTYGLSSAAMVGLSGKLEAWLQRRLAPTLLYDYPTIGALARHLANNAAPIADVPGGERMSAREPIAVIGIGCRFPGADSPAAFWHLLLDGRDAIGEVPLDRWDAAALYDPEHGPPGEISARWGAFLEGVDRFDAAFFGLSPREVEQIDPQQRLVLEVSWEALEHAGIAPTDLAGRPVGVFIGISNSDYARLQFEQADSDPYAGTGSALSIAANRVSYVLDLRGPALAIDTACSSSLVAVHLACESLRRGESSLALAGGVNLILAPQVSATLAQAQMLSPDGRCKTFDAAANGYVRGEGCGVVVLKPLSAAVRDGDAVLALIKGSAVNQDGRSNGLTAPNGLAQQAVIAQALSDADLSPAEIGYIETHGSGTPLGDPIEINALIAVLGHGRAVSESCWLGSVKANIGHLESAAGIAGLIKAILVLHHGQIPPQLYLSTLNPHLEIAGTPFAIPTGRQPWPRTQRRRAAGVSSFGFGGTNAHVVLEEAPEHTGWREVSAPQPQLLVLSAKEAAALRTLAGRYHDAIVADPELPLEDLCWTASTGRAHFEHRLALIADHTGQAREHLAAFAADAATDELLSARAGRAQPKVVFLFTGQGAQYTGMSRGLYEHSPMFRQALDRCAELLRPHLGLDIREVLYPEATNDERRMTNDRPAYGRPAGRPKETRGQGDKETQQSPICNLQSLHGSDTQHSTHNTQNFSSILDQTQYAQPALFAVEYALARLWQSWGIEPAAALGHSVGEYAAACVAGVFSLEDGLRLVVERARLMQALPQDGQMAAVAAGEAEVTELIAPYRQQVSIAAVNGAAQCVISGRADAIEQIVALLGRRNLNARLLHVSHAFHSPLMDPMLEPFAQVAATVCYAAPRIPLAANVSGRLGGESMADPAYWVAQARQPVQFAAAMQALRAAGYTLFVEIGPHPVLLGMGRHGREDDGGLWLPSLRRNHDDWRQILDSLGRLYIHGADIRWRAVGQAHQRLRLPTYPWQRQRYWIAETPVGAAKNLPQTHANGSGEQSGHPLIGRRLPTLAVYADTFCWEVELDSRRLAYLYEHRVGGSAVLSASAYVEMALSAAAEAVGHTPGRLSDLVLHHPLFLSSAHPKTVQLSLSAGQRGQLVFRAYSKSTTRDTERQPWVLHASATIDTDTDRFSIERTPVVAELGA